MIRPNFGWELVEGYGWFFNFVWELVEGYGWFFNFVWELVVPFQFQIKNRILDGTSSLRSEASMMSTKLSHTADRSSPEISAASTLLLSVMCSSFKPLRNTARHLRFLASRARSRMSLAASSSIFIAHAAAGVSVYGVTRCVNMVPRKSIISSCPSPRLSHLTATRHEFSILVWGFQLEKNDMNS
jgi:hypothetical protein